MFEFVRKHTRILQVILVLLILPSFVVFGIQGYSRFASNDGVVAKVDGQKISQAEWETAQRNYVERMRAQKPDVDAALFDTPAFKREALDALVRQYVLTTAARDQHLDAPVARLVRLFSTDPQFAALRNADGSLNKSLLEARGMSPAQFEGMLRQELTVGQVLGAVQGSATTSSLANRQVVDALFQVREVQWMKFDPKAYSAQQHPTDAQLHAFYDDPANAAWLMSPEKADVQYLVLDIDALKQRVSVSEDDLRKSYQENIGHYTSPEERRASHILISVEKGDAPAKKAAARAKAEKLLAELRKNPSLFAELARKNSDDPGSAANGGDLDYFGRGTMVKPFDDAVFAMKPGQISDVVESDFGFHIIELTGVRGGKPQPFEAVRAQIEDDARRQVAQRQFAEAAEKFTNGVYEQSDSLQPVADELKLPLQTMNGVRSQPGDKDQGVFGNAHLLKAVFDATNRSKGRNTEAIEVSPNKLVSARVLKYYPAARRSFADAQSELQARWVAAQALKAARADAEAKMAAWKATPDKSQMPAAVSMSRRTSFSQPPAVLDAAMRVPASELPAWRVVELGADGVALLKVNKVLPLTITPQELTETESQFGGYWAKVEADAYLRALKREYKVEYLNDGLKVEDAAADTSAPQKSAK